MNYFCVYFKTESKKHKHSFQIMAQNKMKSGEFGWIEQIQKQFASLVPTGMEGIGDDCAVIPISGGESLVVTTDMLVEDVHFVLDKIPPVDLGYKSLAVNLSDVAAMGATPIGSFLSIGLPGHLDGDWRDAFLSGYRMLSKKFNVPLLGGDTTASERLVINVTAIGKVPNANIKRRSAAKPGDLICVVGNLGNSVAGLKLLLNKTDYTVAENSLIYAHYHPEPFVKEGAWLGAQEGVHAMMDVSDGIASDLVHILEASRVSAHVELTQLPISNALENVCEANSWNALELAASGGEDYTLLLTVGVQEIADVNREFYALFGRELEIIGQIENGTPQIEWLHHCEAVDVDWKGFSHF